MVLVPETADEKVGDFQSDEETPDFDDDPKAHPIFSCSVVRNVLKVHINLQ